MGRQTRLSAKEKKEIVALFFSEWGFGIGRSEVRSIVSKYCKANKKGTFS